jgi:hypothetical protein
VERQVYLWIVVELVYKNQTDRVVPAQSVIIILGIDIAPYSIKQPLKHANVWAYPMVQHAGLV